MYINNVFDDFEMYFDNLNVWDFVLSDLLEIDLDENSENELE